MNTTHNNLEFVPGPAPVASPRVEQLIRPVPLGLHRKIENRVRVLMLIQRERHWFVQSLVTGGAVLVIVLTAFIVSAFIGGGITANFSGGAPGGMGYLDSAAALASLTWTHILAYAAAAVFLVTLLVLLLACIPIGLYLRRRAL